MKDEGIVMGRTRVKVCGITNAEDALLCVQCGADALGFIFVPDSPRAVTPEQAAAIIARLPVFVDRVGVFIDADEGLMADTVRACRLSVVQLHGNESASLTEKLKLTLKVNILKTFRPCGEGADFASGGGMGRFPADAFLLDSARAGGLSGGTGIELDREVARRVIDSCAKPVVLAGGLRPDNVADAIRRCRPYGVDVCSGTEEKPGRKSREKVIGFFEAVARANAG